MTTPTMLELDDVIRRHAWNLLKKRSNFFRRWLLEEEDYQCDVDWASINFDHNVSKFDLRPDNRTFNTDWGSIKTGTRWVPLHACVFDNRSETKQAHTFRGSRETTTWMAVELTDGYRLANHLVDVDVTFPTQFLHLRAGRDTGFKVDKVKGSVFKEVLHWEVNSQVEVMPSWKAHAQLLARQECHMIDFEVRTTLTVPSGTLPVYFKRRSDNTVAFEVKVTDLEEAFQLPEDGGVLREEERPLVHTLMETLINAEGRSQSSSKLQLVTRGSCVCLAWSDQKVDIKTSPLSVSSDVGDDGDVVIQQDGTGYLAKV